MLNVKRLILGTVQFGLDYGINNSVGKPNQREITNILHYAYDAGIRILDTAESYGNAINIISAYQKTENNKFKIISKFKYFDGLDIEQLVNRTIVALEVENLFCYMFHSFEDLNKYPELLEKIYSMYLTGLIEHIGVSIYTNEQFEKIINRNEINVIQLPYNLLDNDLQRGYLINKAKKMGKIIHVRSVFLQGLFFKDTRTITSNSVLSPLKEDIRNLQYIAKSENISLIALALQYPFNNANIDGVLFGVDTINQLKQNIEEFSQPVDKKIFETIDRIDIKLKHLLLPTNWE